MDDEFVEYATALEVRNIKLYFNYTPNNNIKILTYYR